MFRGCNCYWCNPNLYRDKGGSRQEIRAAEDEEYQLRDLNIESLESKMRIKVTYLISYEHGEWAPDESVFETEIDSWDDLPAELLQEDGRFLDVIKIEVL